MKEFKRGDKVNVIKQGNNASDFNNSKCGVCGVYSVEDWRNKIFEIDGKIELISFGHDPETFCAYLLNLNGKPVGYVYNGAIKKARPIPELTMKEAIEKMGFEFKIK